jgi:hypothetical protein
VSLKKYNRGGVNMNKLNEHITTYACIAGTIFGFSFLTSGLSRVSLITIAILFAISALLFVVSLKSKARWLLRITENMGKISWKSLGIFFTLYGLGMTLIKNNLAIPGVISVFVAYFILARDIGLTIGGEVLRPIFMRVNSKKRKPEEGQGG